MMTITLILRNDGEGKLQFFHVDDFETSAVQQKSLSKVIIIIPQHKCLIRLFRTKKSEEFECKVSSISENLLRMKGKFCGKLSSSNCHAHNSHLLFKMNLNNLCITI